VAATVGAAVKAAGTGATPALADIAVVRLTTVVIGLGVLVAPVPRESGIQVSVSKRGFEPALVNLHKGEPAHLVLKTSDVEHCFAVDELRIEKRIVPGRSTTLDLTPDKAGSFVFYCCLEPDAAALKGKIVVSE
jgi:plastocyanin